jgi:outer membrane protein, heavy metal efflux system
VDPQGARARRPSRLPIRQVSLRARAEAHSRVSHSNAVDADSLRRLAVVRRDAGDASDMDVDLATVNAGQQANVAAADSLAAIGALLDLQGVIGFPSDRPIIALADSLVEPDTSALAFTTSDPPAPTSLLHFETTSATRGGTTSRGDAASAGTVSRSGTVPLQVAAAEEALRSEESNLAVARGGLFAQPTLTAGIEWDNPNELYHGVVIPGEYGPLPTVGLNVPVPLFSHNGGEVALATASRDRAQAELELARRETSAQSAQASRELSVAMERVRRDKEQLELADRVVRLSLTAFAQGASALPNVLEAQRSARDALGQYVDDLAAANAAAAAVRLFAAGVREP